MSIKKIQHLPAVILRLHMRITVHKSFRKVGLNPAGSRDSAIRICKFIALGDGYDGILCAVL